MSVQRFGIFGGTFAPIHTGHLRAAQAFLEACKLDALHVIPTNLPPHKQAQTLFSPTDRLTMARLAFSEVLPDPRIVIDDYEIARGGVSYTYETLAHYAAPDRELWLFCGTDMFLTLSEWKHPEQIFARASIAYMLREAEDAATLSRIAQATQRYEAQFGARIRAIVSEPIAISSTALRAALARGEVESAYLPKSVQHYIQTHRFHLKEQA